MIKYVPILKCKRGEQNALNCLESSVKDEIMPLIEVQFSSTTTKRPIEDIIASFWDRDLFFYFASDWYEDQTSDSFGEINKAIDKYFTPLFETGRAVPVLDLNSLDSISDWGFVKYRGIAIRLRNNELGEVENGLNKFFEKGIIERSNVDLIIDLQYVSADDLFAKTSVLKAAFSDLNNPEQFRSIIIACGSFPKPLPPMEANRIYRFHRVEPEIYAAAIKLARKFGFNYVYSDYGPTDLEEFAFVVGMSPNFKIKYTTFDEYLFIKGLSIKRGGLDLENVRAACRVLVESRGDFSGEDYSWGDNNIYNLAMHTGGGSGNLTTWVSYAMNHHITLIANQV